MNRTAFCLGALIVFCFVASGIAQQEKGGKKNRGLQRTVKTVSTQMMKTFDAAKLTDEQKTKAVEVIKKHAKELADARKEVQSLLTDDQKNARTAAMKKNREDGVKGKAATKAVMDALKMNDEELAKYKEASKKPQEVSAKIRAAILKLLTDEQKAAIAKAGRNRGNGKAGAGKKGQGQGQDQSNRKRRNKKDGGDGGTLQTVSLKLPNMT